MENKIIYKSMLGNIVIVDNGIAITEIRFTKDKELKAAKKNGIQEEAIKQLNEFFDGKRKEFNLKLDLSGTEFQKKVWNALMEIPYGETRTYKDIAVAIGNEKAVRAVGNANNKNFIHVVIPCHRVIGSNGKLIGYAAGLDVKKELLLIEEKNI